MTDFDPHYADDRVVLYGGDCREILAHLAPETGEHGWADAIVCDPPYELKFMSKGWDGTGVAFDPETWKRCYEVLKPGGHLLAFGGSRTWHRMAVAIEDAGFEIRDSIAWLYGSGFPKSMDVSKAIDKAAGAKREVVGHRKKLDSYGEQAGNSVYGGGPNHDGVQLITAPATDAAQQWQGWGTALKPAFEPIVVARKPLDKATKTVAANVLEHGTGALNIDACRVGTDVKIQKAAGPVGGYHGSDHAYEKGTGAEFREGGRWPMNVLLDETQAAELDQQSGILKSGALQPYTERHENASSFQMQREKTYVKSADSGGASRFFPTFNSRDGEATADTNYADSGATDFAMKPGTRRVSADGPSEFFPTFHYQAKAPAKERPKVDGVAHPTVKPLELMRWLIRLVTPADGVIVDPFAGSGTTLEAAMLEAVQVVGIEFDPSYMPLIMHRIERLTK